MMVALAFILSPRNAARLLYLQADYGPYAGVLSAGAVGGTPAAFSLLVLCCSLQGQ
jgi:hypothetical protein